MISRLSLVLLVVSIALGCARLSGDDCAAITNCTASCESGHCVYSGDICTAADTGEICHTGATADALTIGSWTWVDNASVVCADGSTSGYAYRDGVGGDTRLLIYFRMGGACFKWGTAGLLNNCNYLTGSPPAPSADNLGGYTSATFTADDAAFAETGILSTDPVINPFASYRMVFVPYCTGDLHGGANVTTYTDSAHVNHTIHHVGYTNAGIVLAAAAALYPDATQVIAAGSSAGSMGAATNAHRTAALWPSAERLLLADSQFWLRPVYLTSTIANTADARWHFVANLTPWCSECAPSTSNTAVGPWRMYGHLAAAGDLARQAYSSHTKDANISIRWSDTGGNVNLKCSKTGLTEPPFCEYGATAHTGYTYPALGDFQHFAAPTSGHVFFYSPGQTGTPSNYSHILAVNFPGAESGDLTATVQSGVALSDWLTAFRDGSAGFADVQ